MALAVRATIGHVTRPVPASAARIARGRLEAVHLRHLAVHEDEVVGLARRALDAPRGRSSHDVDLVARPSRASCTATRWFIALSSTTRTRSERRGSPAATGAGRRRAATAAGERRAVTGADARLRPDGDREPERAAPARLALHADRAAHQLDQLLADREPQAGAAVPPRRRAVGLRERLEQPPPAPRSRCRCRCRATSKRTAPGSSSAVGRGCTRTTTTRPRCGELDRVADQVDRICRSRPGSPVTTRGHVRLR